MFDINSFKSALPYGGARPSLFDIRIPLPAGMDLGSHGADSSRALTLNAKSTTIPTGTIEPVEVPYFGRIFKMPGGRTFDEWTTTVSNDEDFRVRDLLEQWMDSINGNVTNQESITQSQFGVTPAVDGIVTQYGKNGNAIRRYVMKGCWPSTLGEITLDWSEASAIEEFEVTWQFNWWESAAIEGAGREVLVEVDTIAQYR